MRVVNVVDLMKLQPPSEHPHGLPDRDFDALFTTDKPIIFAFHGYPWLIHRLTYRRHEPRQPARARLQGGGHDDDAVRHGACSTTSTASTWSSDVIDRVPQLATRAAYAKQAIRDKLLEHKQYIARYGDDMPEIRDWRWGQCGAAAAPADRHRGRQRVSPTRATEPSGEIAADGSWTYTGREPG